MDLQEAFDAGFEAVKAYLDDAFAAFEARIKALEERAPEPGQPGKDGLDGKDGKDADPEAVAVLVRDEVEKAIAAIPAPQDGESVTVEDVEPVIADRVSAAVAEAVKAIPVPRDGVDGKDGKDGKDGRDGLDAVTPLLQDGKLLFTMSDGSVKEVGQVVGRDGQDGTPGKDGRDGFQLESFDAKLMEDGRTILLSFEQKDLIHSVEIGIPAMIYRGVYQEGREYEQGDTVTWGGSLWHCDVEKTAEKPDSAEKHWTLAAKRGRDGKAGKDGEIKAKQPVKVGA